MEMRETDRHDMQAAITEGQREQIYTIDKRQKGTAKEEKS